VPKRGAASHEDTDVGMVKFCISVAVSQTQRATWVCLNLVPGARRVWGKGGLRVSASAGLCLWGLHGAVFGWLGLSFGTGTGVGSMRWEERTGEDMDWS
jgi:hypothetical protein